MTHCHARRCFATISAVAACASCAAPSDLSDRATWDRLRQAAIEARCDPYFSNPFSSAALVDVAVIGRADDVVISLSTEVEQAGTYALDVEHVLYGHMTPSRVILDFHWQQDAVGHRYGSAPPTGRSIVYLRNTSSGEFEVVKEFSC
jgi:hypothetical protein